METVGVPWDSYVLKTKAYKFILKVRKFQLPTGYSFSTAEGETWLWVDSALPPPPGLNRVKIKLPLLSLHRIAVFQEIPLVSRPWPGTRLWLNDDAMFHETFYCFYISKAKLLCFSLYSQMFDDVERCWICNIQNVCHVNEQLSLCYFFSQ